MRHLAPIALAAFACSPAAPPADGAPDALPFVPDAGVGYTHPPDAGPLAGDVVLAACVIYRLHPSRAGYKTREWLLDKYRRWGVRLTAAQRASVQGMYLIPRYATALAAASHKHGLPLYETLRTCYHESDFRHWRRGEKKESGL